MEISKEVKSGFSRKSICASLNRGDEFANSPSLNFEHNGQYKLLKKSVKNFAESVLGPVAKIVDEEARFSWETAAELSRINAWGIQIPEQYGGAELDTISYAITIEEISRICASTALNVSAHNSLGAYPIFKWGTEEQKERYLPDISKGKKICAFALTEPNAGSDAGGINSLAVQDGEGFILNGSKIFITNGGIASTVLAISKCKMENGDKGTAAFILDSDMEGYEVGKKEDKMGMRGSDTSSIYFNDVHVPRENMLGTHSDGFKIALNALDYGRVGIAAQSIGIAQAAYERSVKYAKNRIQFKKSISNFQAISFKLAEMSAKIETTRLLIQRTAFMRDKGMNFSKDAAMCKYLASKVAREVAEEAIQIHGGYGYMKDLPLERYYRDAKACEIYEGTSEILKSIIAQHILRGNL